MYGLAVDPGKVTGVCDLMDDGTVRSYEVPGGIKGFVSDVFVSEAVDFIFCEKWEVLESTHKLGREPDAYKIMGYLEGKALEFGVPYFEIPRGHKGNSHVGGKNSKTLELGWAKRTGDGHAEDAASVLLFGLTQYFLKDPFTQASLRRLL